MTAKDDRRPPAEAATGVTIPTRIAGSDDIEARFAALDHLTYWGLASELVEHALWAPLNCCFCSRCVFLNAEAVR